MTPNRLSEAWTGNSDGTPPPGSTQTTTSGSGSAAGPSTLDTVSVRSASANTGDTGGDGASFDPDRYHVPGSWDSSNGPLAGEGCPDVAGLVQEALNSAGSNFGSGLTWASGKLCTRTGDAVSSAVGRAQFAASLASSAVSLASSAVNWAWKSTQPAPPSSLATRTLRNVAPHLFHGLWAASSATGLAHAWPGTNTCANVAHSFAISATREYTGTNARSDGLNSRLLSAEETGVAWGKALQSVASIVTGAVTQDAGETLSGIVSMGSAWWDLSRSRAVPGSGVWDTLRGLARIGHTTGEERRAVMKAAAWARRAKRGADWLKSAMTQSPWTWGSTVQREGTQPTDDTEDELGTGDTGG